MQSIYEKQPKPAETIKTCGECFFATPDNNFKSFITHKPILGKCRFQKYMFLLSNPCCTNYKDK